MRASANLLRNRGIPGDYLARAHPQWEEVGVFFVMTREAVDKGGLSFQIKNEPPIILDTANRRGKPKTAEGDRGKRLATDRLPAQRENGRLAEPPATSAQARVDAEKAAGGDKAVTQPAPANAADANASTSVLPEPWQRDWKEFLQTNERIHSARAEDVNRVFAGRIVEWTGRFERVNEHGNVLVAMEPAEAKSWVSSPKNWNGQLETVNTSRLLLSPMGEELAKWTNVRKGDKVVFRTKLSGDASPVVLVAPANNRMLVMTEGAKLLRVISDDAASLPVPGTARAPVRLSGKQKADVALVAQWVFMPNISDYLKTPNSDRRREPEDRPSGRLDHTPEPTWEHLTSDMDVATAILGAIHAGRAAGYQFTPAQPVKKGQKPRDIIAKLATDSDVVLLVRVRMFPSPLGEKVVMVLGDAALYRLPRLEVVFSAGFMGSDELDDRHASGDDRLSSDIEVLGRVDDTVKRSKAKMATAARAFARGFDGAVLARMQEMFQKQEIVNAIAQVKRRDNPAALTPMVTELKGKERPAEFKIARGKGGTDGTVYLGKTGGGSERRWLLSTLQPVETGLEPGSYTIYAEIPSESNPQEINLYRCELNVEYNRSYSFTVP